MLFYKAALFGGKVKAAHVPVCCYIMLHQPLQLYKYSISEWRELWRVNPEKCDVRQRTQKSVVHWKQNLKRLYFILIFKIMFSKMSTFLVTQNIMGDQHRLIYMHSLISLSTTLVFHVAIIYFSNFNFMMLLIYGSYGNDVQPRMWSRTPYGVYIQCPEVSRTVVYEIVTEHLQYRKIARRPSGMRE